MKHIFLYILAMFFCVSINQVNADEFDWAKKAREEGPSPATKAAYDKAVAQQEAKRESQRQEALKQQEQFKKFEEEQDANRAEYETEQERLQKECGTDYGQIRVGMKLARVQKCVGEFFLHGQKRWGNGTVDYFTRGGAYLYVKGGKVVAWGE